MYGRGACARQGERRLALQGHARTRKALFENLEDGARIDDFLEWFPGVTREQITAATGWPIRFASHTTETHPPSATELEALHALLDRTRRAHGE